MSCPCAAHHAGSRQRATTRAKLVQDRKSTTCEHSVRPTFTAAVPDQEKLENCRKIIDPSSNRHQAKPTPTHCLAKPISAMLPAQPDSNDHGWSSPARWTGRDTIVD